MKTMTRNILVLVPALLLLALSGAQAADKAAEKAKAAAPAAKATSFKGDYDACLALLDKSPQDALDYATKWAGAGGDTRLAAFHCKALALSDLGHHEEAAKALSEVALGMEAAPREDQAQAFAQVADAWFVAGNSKRARVAIDQALALHPTAGYLLDRANIRASEKDWAGAREDTSLLLSEEPTSADALTLRATASRNLGSIASALADANRAVDIAPHNLSSLLERGRSKAAAMDVVGARADWQAVVDMAAKTGRTDDARAQAAQVYLKGK
ncbi:MAG: hypothetical protein ACOH12_02150 [Parvibaculaceae bacterium]